MIYYKNRVSEGSTVDFLWCRAKYILAKVCPDRKTGIQCNMTQVIEKGAGFSQTTKILLSWWKGKGRKFTTVWAVKKKSIEIFMDRILSIKLSLKHKSNEAPFPLKLYEGLNMLLKHVYLNKLSIYL